MTSKKYAETVEAAVSHSRDLTHRYRAAMMNTFGAPKQVLIKGQGAQVWDADGNRYLDFLGGIAVNALGHAHPRLVEAVSSQFSALGHISNFFASGPQIELAERLLELVFPTDAAGGRVFFSNSGTEANEAAFKLTRRTGRTQIVAARGGFHGRTMGALAITSKEEYRAPFAPLPGEVTFVPYGDVSALEAAVSENTAAVVLEPIQGEAGVVVAPEGYLAAARRITDASGALLWLDEIQTGMGRTGQWMAHHSSAIVPDIVTLAKGLGGGFPIGATLAHGGVAHLFEPGNHGTTFGGNPMACAAGLAVIEVIEEENLLEQVKRLGQQLREGLEAHPQVVATHGAGLLIGIELAEARSQQIVTAGMDAGVIMNNPTPTRVRLAPPFILTQTEVAEFLDKWPGIVAAASA